MAKVQVNVKLDEKLIKEVTELIDKGYLKNKTEAFTEALRLLLRKYKADEIKMKMDQIRRGTEKLPSVTGAVVESHKEEDRE